MACEHANHEATVNVFALTQHEGGETNAWSADIRIGCADCGEAFGFRGVPVGLSPRFPCASVDTTEIRLPLWAPSQLTLAQMAGGLAPDGDDAMGIVLDLAREHDCSWGLTSEGKGRNCIAAELPLGRRCISCRARALMGESRQP